MTTNINYQQIFEEEVSGPVRDQLELGNRFYELTNEQRLFIEELVEAGYQRAIEDALDRDVLEETASLTVEMAGQLNGFADLLRSYLNTTPVDDG
jgi:hypothetical protein